MSSRPPLKNLSEPTAESSDLSDLEALDQFCQGIDLEEIGFETWCDHHKNLDLIFHLRLTEAELQNGCLKSISFTRTIKEHTKQGIRNRREKSEAWIHVPAGSRHGETIVLNGLGDQDGKTSGNLLVKI